MTCNIGLSQGMTSIVEYLKRKEKKKTHIYLPGLICLKDMYSTYIGRKTERNLKKKKLLELEKFPSNKFLKNSRKK